MRNLLQMEVGDDCKGDLNLVTSAVADDLVEYTETPHLVMEGLLNIILLCSKLPVVLVPAISLSAWGLLSS